MSFRERQEGMEVQMAQLEAEIVTFYRANIHDNNWDHSLLLPMESCSKGRSFRLAKSMQGIQRARSEQRK
jgi:hypothetical protein